MESKGNSGSIYVSPEVAGVIALHPYAIEPDWHKKPIYDALELQASTLKRAHDEGDERVLMHLQSWWPDANGKPKNQIMSGSFSIADAQLTMAREYGFDDWGTVASLYEKAPDSEFEWALDTMLKGDIAQLGDQLAAKPSLARQHSHYGHRATLLHYLGANGVESFRQVVPMNAPKMAKLLIDHGADIHAEANMYGGGQTPLMLATTSAHPIKAGITDQLFAVLKQH